MEEVIQFCNLGSTVTEKGDIMEEVKIRIGKANGAFTRLKNIWKSNRIGTTTKIRLYVSNVRSVLMYGTETWRNNKEVENKMRAFEGRCLRNILKIHWPNIISNKHLAERTKLKNVTSEIKRRRWNWLGHVLRMKKTRHPNRALYWKPMEKRQRGRPKGTFRRTIEEEMQKNKTWRELTWMAQDRNEWFQFVDALCHTSDEED